MGEPRFAVPLENDDRAPRLHVRFFNGAWEEIEELTMESATPLAVHLGIMQFVMTRSGVPVDDAYVARLLAKAVLVTLEVEHD